MSTPTSIASASAASSPSLLRALDLSLYRAARTLGHPAAIERAVRRFSLLGEHAAIWLALGTAGMVLDPGRRPQWRAGTRAVAGAYALNTALKLLVRRRRPHVPGLPPLVPTPTELSFPSAHATTSFTGARAFAPLCAPSALYALACGLALSRLYLGVHYPSDVLAGAVLGTVIGERAR